MGLLMIKTACKSDPTLFQESFEMLENALHGLLSPLLYNGKPLSQQTMEIFSKLRSTFTSIAVNKGRYTLNDNMVYEFIRLVLTFGISRGSVSDIIQVARLLILQQGRET